MGLQRDRKLKEAQRKFDKLQKKLDKIQEPYDEAWGELEAIKRSYDIGDRVKVKETCGRGCCLENEYSGTVQGTHKNGSYQIMDTDGHLWEYVSEYDMARIE